MKTMFTAKGKYHSILMDVFDKDSKGSPCNYIMASGYEGEIFYVMLDTSTYFKKSI